MVTKFYGHKFVMFYGQFERFTRVNMRLFFRFKG
jgi:hypothetical protein